ncbi:MAG: amidohydrolase [Pirellulales bacterium]|nr:amidohydrolase [Pirellulales bacterium]
MPVVRCAILIAAFASTLAGSVGDAACAAEPAALVVFGKTWTGAAVQPWAEAIAIRGERIVAVGARGEINELVGPETRIVDAGAGLVVPGMGDSHIHLVSGGAHLASVQLRDAATPEEFARRIGEYARTLPAGAWITGGDWDHTHWGGQLPQRSWIDAVAPDHPVWIARLDGHMALANTAAMRAAGVGDDVADVPGGEIVRNAAGRPTGVFKDNAMGLIARAVPDPTMPQKLAAITAACDYLAERGVTMVHHMGEFADVAALRLAQSRGLLTVRVYACTPLDQWRQLADEIADQGRGNDLLRIGGLKGFVDGSLGSHTAAMLEPFADDPSSRGLLVCRRDDLYRWTKEADRAGLQVMVHAIGDRAIRLQLDVFEQVARENGPRDRRFRIEHAQHIHPDDLPRFARQGVVASMQPYHAIDDGRWAEAVIGPERSATTYAFRSLLDDGARLALGSDWFVAPATPLEGIAAAATRRTLDGKHPGGWVPAQKIAVEEALRAYTAGVAYAGFQEERLGTLEPGKLADLVVLDRNLLETTDDDLPKVRVMATVVGGKMTYRRAAE